MTFRPFILTLTLWLGSLALNAQDQAKIDSLWTVWDDHTQPNTARLEAINALTLSYWHDNPDTAIILAEKQLAFAQRLGLKKWQAKAYTAMGKIYGHQGEYLRTLEYFLKSLKLYEETADRNGIANSYHNIGGIYGSLDDNPKAIEYYNKSVRIKEEIGDMEGMKESYNRIAKIYHYQGNQSKALEYTNKALEIIIVDSIDRAYYRDIIAKAEAESKFLNSGEFYSKKLARFDSLSAVWNDAQQDDTNRLKAIDKLASDASTGHLFSKFRLRGYIFFEHIPYFAQLQYDFAKEKGIKQYQVKALNTQALFFYSNNDYGQFIESVARILKVMKKTGDELAVANILDQIGKKYKHKGDWQRAGAETEKRLELEKQEAIANEERKRQQVIIWSVSGGLLLIVVFAFFIANRLRITRRQKTVIEEQKQVVEEKNTEIMDSIQYAKRIQTAILPPQKLVKQYLEESFILYKPKDIVAGDFYWMETVLPDGEDSGGAIIFFTAADCTGHGVPGAMVSVLCSTALSKAVKELGIYEPAKILDKTVELLEERFAKSEEEVKDGMDLALCALSLVNSRQSLEKEQMTNDSMTNDQWLLEYAGANNPLYHIRNGELNIIKADKQPIGKYEGRKPFTNHRITLNKGDSIYIFSDGFADQFGGPKGKKFKYKPFRELILANHDKPMEEQKQLLDECIENWRGELEQVDDICIIGVRV